MLQFISSPKAGAPLKAIDSANAGSWLRAERPNDEEKQALIELGVDHDILHDALDPHEIPRVELEDDWTYFITRLPDTDDEHNDFTTPILFALSANYIVTVSRDSLGRLWQPFIDTTALPTAERERLFMQMMESITLQYQRRVAAINRQMRAATGNVELLRSQDITVLTKSERKLNDYLDALIPTNTAIRQLLGGKLLKLAEDELDEAEDLSIDIEQLISRCKSLLRTITNLRDSYRAVMDTKLNETIRLLTVITLALTIPTMLAGLYGMNVTLPGSGSPVAFWFIISASIIFAVSLSVYFLRRR